LDTYLEALKSFPKTDVKLKTKKGTAVCQKIDIFKGLLWYAYEGEWMNWHTLTPEQANKIIAKNKKDEAVGSLEEYALDLQLEEDDKKSFNNGIGEDSLTRFDKPKQQHKRRNNKSKNKKRKKYKGNTSKSKNA
jgi:hypothetical protein